VIRGGCAPASSRFRPITGLYRLPRPYPDGSRHLPAGREGLLDRRDGLPPDGHRAAGAGRARACAESKTGVARPARGVPHLLDRHCAQRVFSARSVPACKNPTGWSSSPKTTCRRFCSRRLLLPAVRPAPVLGCRSRRLLGMKSPFRKPATPALCWPRIAGDLRPRRAHGATASPCRHLRRSPALASDAVPVAPGVGRHQRPSVVARVADQILTPDQLQQACPMLRVGAAGQQVDVIVGPPGLHG
jgi:hypothetical protein